MSDGETLETRQLVWQARIKRLCLYMLGVPVLAFAALSKGYAPAPVLIGVMVVIALFITSVLWTYFKL